MNATNLLKQLPTTLWRHILWHHRLMTSIGAYRQQTTVANPRFPGGDNPKGDVKCRWGANLLFGIFFTENCENKKTIGLRGIRHWTLQVYKASLRCLVPHFSLWLLDLLPSDIDWSTSQVLVSTWVHILRGVNNQDYHSDPAFPQKSLIDIWLIFDWFWIDCLETRFHFNLGRRRDADLLVC